MKRVKSMFIFCLIRFWCICRTQFEPKLRKRFDLKQQHVTVLSWKEKWHPFPEKETFELTFFRHKNQFSESLEKNKTRFEKYLKRIQFTGWERSWSRSYRTELMFSLQRGQFHDDQFAYDWQQNISIWYFLYELYDFRFNAFLSNFFYQYWNIYFRSCSVYVHWSSMSWSSASDKIS